MKIALIGRGKLATNLLPALQHAGHDVVSVNSRTLEELPQTADAYIIAVKDSVLADVIRAVTKGREEQVFMHTAGSMPMSLFQGLAHHYGVFYPMQSFSKERTVYFAEIPTFIEASDDKTKQVIRQLAESVTQHVIELSSDDRQYLHLAYALAAEILEQHGMDFNVMLPLIDETARKVHQLHPLQAQTGPAMRYDENVIRHQLELLNDNPAAREIYERMSMNIHRKVTEK